jgi:hypothetical protein
MHYFSSIYKDDSLILKETEQPIKVNLFGDSLGTTHGGPFRIMAKSYFKD